MTRTLLGRDLDPHTLRAAFGAFPSGVVAVAAQVRGQLTGIAASSFTSVSIDPRWSPSRSPPPATPGRCSARPRTSASACSPTTTTRSAASSRAPPTSVRRAALPVHRGRRGLLDEAVATFDCSIHQEIEAGDHLVVLLALHGVSDGGDRTPLVFHRSGFATLSAAELDQTKLDGRINGKDVDAA